VSLVCAAFLAEELRALLEKTFAHVSDTVRKLFDGTGSLATFSSRIDLALAIGLISEESHRALHLIRKIRNDFAHQYGERSFHDQDVSARCRELIPLNPSVDEKDPRKLFIRAVLSILAQIHAKSALTEHAVVPSPRPIATLRDSFADLQKTLNALMANLTEEEMARLSNPETNMAEKKRLILETLVRIGVTPQKGSS
jgi:DNA-binding MltR family transcriptional regulator